MLERIIRKAIITGLSIFTIACSNNFLGNNGEGVGVAGPDILYVETPDSQDSSGDVRAETGAEILCQERCYTDNDGDTFGNKNDYIISCEQLEKCVPESPTGFWDCDDNNIKVYPFAPELCDKVDNNCNGIIDEINENIEYKNWYEDKDEDGFGNPFAPFINDCKQPPGPPPYVDNDLDCDDNNNSSYPGFPKEICDNADNDCNGLVDDELVKYCSTDCGNGIEECVAGIWQECTAPKPEPEVCDRVDNDCNWMVDDGLLFEKWYEDLDGDEYGSSTSKEDCKQPPGFVQITGDCDDMDPNIFPTALDTCNNKDDNCDGETDEDYDSHLWFEDADGDGQGGLEPIMLASCEPPEEGFVQNSLDCDDRPDGEDGISWNADDGINIKSGSVLWRSDYSELECSVQDYPFLALGHNGTVFVNDKDGLLYALNPANGLPVISNEIAIDPTISEDGTIYVRDDDKYSKIAAFNNILSEEWNYDFSHCITGQFFDVKLTSDSGLYHISLAFDGTIYASAKFHDYNWADAFCGYIKAIPSSGDEENWKYNIDYFHTGTSVGPQEIVYAAKSSTLHAINPNGTSKWTKNLGSMINGNIKTAPVFDLSGSLYFTTTNNELVKYNPASEQVVWTKEEWGEKLPVIDSQGRIYTKRGALNHNGFLIWNSNNTYDFSDAALTSDYIEAQGVSALQRTLYLFGESGLHAVNPTNGNLLWKLETDEQTMQQISPANLAIGKDGTIYFCNAMNNQVYAVCGTQSLDEDAAWPIARHDNQRTGNFNME